MRKRYLILLLLMICGLGVFAYNYWSYSCGRCNMDSLLTVGMPSAILIGVNLLSLVGLVVIKLSRRNSTDALLCSCGERLHSAWQYCPCCGQTRIVSV